MKRKVLLLTVLLIVLTLTLTTSTVAKGPSKGEWHEVIFGEISPSDISGEGVLLIDRRGKNLAIPGYIGLTFHGDKFDGPGNDLDFRGFHEDGALRITFAGTNSGEVEMGYGFDLKDFGSGDCIKSIREHGLRGSGTYTFNEGIYTVTLTDAAISQHVPHFNKKCKGYGLETVELFSVSPIEFTMTIRVIVEQ